MYVPYSGTIANHSVHNLTKRILITKEIAIVGLATIRCRIHVLYECQDRPFPLLLFLRIYSTSCFKRYCMHDICHGRRKSGISA